MRVLTSHLIKITSILFLAGMPVLAESIFDENPQTNLDSDISIFDENLNSEFDAESGLDSVKSFRLNEEVIQQQKSVSKASQENIDTCCSVDFRLNGHACGLWLVSSPYPCDYVKYGIAQCNEKAKAQERKSKIAKANWERKKPILLKMCKAIQTGNHAETKAMNRRLLVLKNDLDQALNIEDSKAEQRAVIRELERKRKTDELNDAANKKHRLRLEQSRIKEEKEKADQLKSCKILWAEGRNPCGCSALAQLPVILRNSKICGV